jgi:hypothetical protein
MTHGVRDLTALNITSSLKQVSKPQDRYGEGDMYA